MSHTTLPPVVLAIDAPWPPADNGRPAGVCEVGAWSVERELVGSMLPGNVRARTGLSVGSASASVPQPAGGVLSPWARDPSRRVGVGVPARLYVDAVAGPVPLGSWVTAPTSGALTSAEVGVELHEAQSRGKRGRNLLARGVPTEAATMVAALARECGFHSVPPPVGGHWWERALFAAPISYGVDQFDAGGAWVSGVPVWSTRSGALGASGFGLDVGDIPPRFVATVNLSADTSDVFELQCSDFTLSAGLVRISPSMRTVAVQSGSGAWSAPVAWPVGSPDPTNPLRVQVEFAMVGEPGAFTAARARVRASLSSPWSPWAEAAGLSASAGSILTVRTGGVSMSGLQVTLDSDLPDLYAAPSAWVEPLGQPAAIRWAPHDMTSWDAIQAICGANMGAAWVERDGRFACRNRGYLSGGGPDVYDVDVSERVEDVGWSIDPADGADRLVVTYAPGGNVAGPGVASNVWAATERLSVAAGASIDIDVPLSGPADVVTGWDHASLIPPGSETANWPRSIFSAMTAESGGVPINVLLLEFRTIWVSSSMVTIRVTNKSAGRAWLVDANGEPCVFVQALNVRSFDAVQSVERGVSAEDAVNAVTVDLGHWVSSASAAVSAADYLWGRVSDPAWKASAVRIVPDPSVDLGQVVRLIHAESDLDVKALVVKVALSGDAGSITQELDLVLLPPTWTDFDAAWIGRRWTDFDAHWAGRAWTDFDFNPLES